MTESPKILVTGGCGCIGVQTIRWLLQNTDAAIVAGSREVSAARTERLFHDVSAVDRARLRFAPLDVRNRPLLEKLLTESEITHVIHLAALQTPDCMAHRDTGLQINLAGTQNLIEAVKACRPALQRFVFASSIAIYGPRRLYPGPRVPMLADPAPVNVYGVWKLAGEHVCRLFNSETGIPTVSLRPGVLFGPGRDAGLTAAPTTAMKCVALGQPFEIPFRTRQDYLYSPDVGAAFGKTAVAPFTGYGVFALPSHAVDTAEIISALQQAAAETGLAQGFAITAGTADIPFVCDLEYAPFVHAFPGTPLTPLPEAIASSLRVFRMQKDRGWLKC